MSHISFNTKPLGQRSAGKPHAALDEAGAGNVPNIGGAPVLDPTGEEKQGNSPTTPCFLLHLIFSIPVDFGCVDGVLAPL